MPKSEGQMFVIGGRQVGELMLSERSQRQLLWAEMRVQPELTPQAVHLQPDPHWQEPGPEHVHGPILNMI